MEQKGIRTHPAVVLMNFLLACVLIVFFFWISLYMLGYKFDFSFVTEYHVRIGKGFGMTVALSLASMAASLAIGILCAVAQNSKVLVFKSLSGIYVTFIRGTPLIMQVYLFFYMISTAWGITNRFVAGFLCLSIFEGAYIGEIIRGSFLSIDQTQLEAARAVGFTNVQTVRYVIVPQMVARTLPALTGQFASIIKDSSLLSMIAVIELAQTIREISAANFKMFECYLFMGLLYLCLTLPISFLSKKLERRFEY